MENFRSREAVNELFGFVQSLLPKDRAEALPALLRGVAIAVSAGLLLF